MSDQVLALIAAHKWLALASVLIGLLVRLAKSDTPIVVRGKRLVIPARARPWVVAGLAIAAGGIDKVASGATWKQAATFAFFSGVLPMLGHIYGVESLLGGEEIPLPDAPKDPPPPAAPPPAPTDGPDATPPSGTPIPPIAARWSLRLLAFGFAISLLGCPGAKTPSLDLSSPTAMRAILALEAQAIVEADKVCGDVAHVLSVEAESKLDLAGVKHAAAVNLQCSKIAEDAKVALLVGQSVLDAYEDGMQGRIGCAAGAGIDALRQIRNLVEGISNQALPPSVEQAIDGALALMSIAAPACPLPPPSGDAGPDGDADAGEGG